MLSFRVIKDYEAVRESQFQSRLLKALRLHPALQDAVIFKHSDRFNTGVPDFSVTTREGRTTWWELKVAPNRLTKIQQYYLAKLRYSWCVTLQHSALGAVSIYPQGIMTLSSAHVFQFRDAIEEIMRRCVGEESTRDMRRGEKISMSELVRAYK